MDTSARIEASRPDGDLARSTAEHYESHARFFLGFQETELVAQLQMDLVLGARVEDACVGPQQLLTAIKQFKGLPYAITYRPDKRRVMIMLEESASPHDLLQAAFHGHYVLHRINSRG